MPALSQRIREDELMDQPGLNPTDHQRALSGLSRVNWWSRTPGYLWRGMKPLIQKHGLERIRILDLACGAGDVSRGLYRCAQRSGVPLTVHGWDKSPTAVQYAELQAKRLGLSDVSFFVRDVIRDPIDEPYDVVICTLFLHHLKTEEILPFLQKMKSAAKHAVLVDDLRRTHWGYTLAWLGTRALTRSPIVHTDGPMSVQAALSVQEIQTLADSAGMQTAAIHTHWPQRFLLRWERT